MMDFELNYWDVPKRVQSQMELRLEEVFAERPVDSMLIQ